MDTSKKIFKITVFASFLIYLYLAYKNCCKYQKMKISNENTKLIGTRCLASILVLVASSLFLSCQLRDEKPTNPSIE